MQIDSLRISDHEGMLGLAPCPGLGEARGFVIGRRRKIVVDDLAAIRKWGATAIVSLVESFELDMLGVPALGQDAMAVGFDWYHMPIPDMCAPGPSFERQWEEHWPFLRQRLASGERVLVHCLAGLGRTGTVAARILVEKGVEPVEAVRRVRTARQGAIQSQGQLDYVLSRRWTTAQNA